MSFQKSNKIKIFRVITQKDVVEWHLNNFLVRSENEFDVYVIGNNVSFYNKQYQHIKFIDLNIKRRINLLSDIYTLILLCFYMIKYRPTIVHSIMPKAGLLSSISGFLTKRPVRIHTYTGQVWANTNGFKRKFLIFLDKLMIRLNTNNLTDSPSQSVFLLNNGVSVGGKLIPCLGIGSLTGVDIENFNYNKLIHIRPIVRNKLNIKENEFVLLFLGRKSIVKGIINLFESFNDLSDLNLKLLFIGPDESGGKLDELLYQYSHLTHKIIQLDSVSFRQQYIIASDLLCLPSSIEGFGSIVIDSAALGLPTIGFNIVGLVDAIENNKTGILVENGSSSKFAKAIRYVVENEEVYKTFKSNCISRAANFFGANLLYEYQKEFYLKSINKS
jgi:glycosyltransferase involved in cell wall biosynthesis